MQFIFSCLLTLAGNALLAQDTVLVSPDNIPVHSDGGTNSKFAVFHLERVPVTVSPAVIVLNDTRTTTTVRITNTYNDTVAVWTSVRYAIPINKHQGAVTTNAATEDSIAREIQRLDSLAEEWSLETWVKKIPKHIILGPNQTVEQVVTLNVPKNLPVGEYSAHLILGMSLIKALPGSKPKMMDGTDVPEEMLKLTPPGFRNEDGAFTDFPLDVSKLAPAFAKIVYRIK